MQSKLWRVHETGKEERTGRVGGDECQGCLCESSKSEKKGLKDGGETCCDEWLRDGGTDKKTGGGAEDVQILIRNEQDGQD